MKFCLFHKFLALWTLKYDLLHIKLWQIFFLKYTTETEKRTSVLLPALDCIIFMSVSSSFRKFKIKCSIIRAGDEGIKYQAIHTTRIMVSRTQEMNITEKLSMNQDNQWTLLPRPITLIVSFRLKTKQEPIINNSDSLASYRISFSWTIDLIIMAAEYTQARVMNMGKVLAMAMMNLSSM